VLVSSFCHFFKVRFHIYRASFCPSWLNSEVHAVVQFTDASDLREAEKVRASQEKALQALQHYTLAHYPEIPSKFGELLLRIPELQRTCQVG
jgi:hypothetical protein